MISERVYSHVPDCVLSMRFARADRRHQHLKRIGDNAIKQVARRMGKLIWPIFKIDFAIVRTKIICLAVIVHAQRVPDLNELSTDQVAYHPEPPYCWLVAVSDFDKVCLHILPLT